MRACDCVACDGVLGVLNPMPQKSHEVTETDLAHTCPYSESSDLGHCKEDFCRADRLFLGE
jgi:hypothetical protein